MESEDDVFDISKFTFSGDFEQQVSEVVDHIHLNVLSFTGLFLDLDSVLSPVWGDEICIIPFGSIKTGLGIRGSDVDCYVRLPSWMHPLEKGTVIKAKNILAKYEGVFQHVFAIVNAKVPIVQFYHVPTKTYCDLSFDNPAAVLNSRLIENLFNSNTKALQLALLVKYWSKIHNLTGTNLMSSYCLTLLVVFFLQQINLLPSIEVLQEDIEESLLQEWNTAFSIPKKANWDSISMYELLGEFFSYYKKFEFNKYIVSPYVGKPINRELFEKVESVPSNFSLYKTNIDEKNLEPLRLDAVMCVQDPFEHNRNCALSVYAKLGLKISAQLQKATDIYETGNQRIFLKELLQSSTPDNIPARKKKRNRPPINVVKKNIRQNQKNKRQNIKHVKRNIRQIIADKGWVQGSWRGNTGKFRRN